MTRKLIVRIILLVIMSLLATSVLTGTVLTQDITEEPTTADGTPSGYPTSAWRPAPAFPDNRTLTIPSDMPPGDYWLYVGWYNPQNVVERLPIQGDSTRDNLYLLQQVTIDN